MNNSVETDKIKKEKHLNTSKHDPMELKTEALNEEQKQEEEDLCHLQDTNAVSAIFQLPAEHLPPSHPPHPYAIAINARRKHKTSPHQPP